MSISALGNGVWDLDSGIDFRGPGLGAGVLNFICSAISAGGMGWAGVSNRNVGMQADGSQVMLAASDPDRGGNDMPRSNGIA